MVKLKQTLEKCLEENKNKYRAKTVRYEAASRKLHVLTECGQEKVFDIDRLQGLRGVSDEDAANIEMLAAGTGLHWPAVDASLLVHELCSGIYGSAQWMSHLSAHAPS